MTAHLKPAGDGQLRLSGVLDFDSVTELRPLLAPYLQAGTQLSLDLRRVTHGNSAGLALLLEWMQEATKAGSKLSLHHVPVALLEIARLSNLETLLPAPRP
ncbi:MAG: STAS domain-containing protein [Pseudomonadota bacterium]